MELVNAGEKEPVSTQFPRGKIGHCATPSVADVTVGTFAGEARSPVAVLGDQSAIAGDPRRRVAPGHAGTVSETLTVSIVDRSRPFVREWEFNGGWQSDQLLFWESGTGFAAAGWLRPERRA